MKNAYIFALLVLTNNMLWGQQPQKSEQQKPEQQTPCCDKALISKEFELGSCYKIASYKKGDIRRQKTDTDYDQMFYTLPYVEVKKKLIVIYNDKDQKILSQEVEKKINHQKEFAMSEFNGYEADLEKEILDFIRVQSFYSCDEKAAKNKGGNLQ